MIMFSTILLQNGQNQQKIKRPFSPSHWKIMLRFFEFLMLFFSFYAFEQSIKRAILRGRLKDYGEACLVLRIPSGRAALVLPASFIHNIHIWIFLHQNAEFLNVFFFYAMQRLSQRWSLPLMYSIEPVYVVQEEVPTNMGMCLRSELFKQRIFKLLHFTHTSVLSANCTRLWFIGFHS